LRKLAADGKVGFHNKGGKRTWYSVQAARCGRSAQRQV
jgi:hypothetical protein